MRRRAKVLIAVIAVITLCALLLIVFPKGALSAEHAELLFRIHRSRFENAAALILEQRQESGASVPPGVSDIDLHETQSGCVDFYMGGFGIAPSSAFWGVICTAEDSPIGWGGLDVEYMWDGEGWYWQEESSDNHSYVTKLDDHWYLYQMWF